MVRKSSGVSTGWSFHRIAVALLGSQQARATKFINRAQASIRPEDCLVEQAIALISLTVLTQAVSPARTSRALVAADGPLAPERSQRTRTSSHSEVNTVHHPGISVGGSQIMGGHWLCMVLPDRRQQPLFLYSSTSSSENNIAHFRAIYSHRNNDTTHHGP